MLTAKGEKAVQVELASQGRGCPNPTKESYLHAVWSEEKFKAKRRKFSPSFQRGLENNKQITK